MLSGITLQCQRKVHAVTTEQGDVPVGTSPCDDDTSLQARQLYLFCVRSLVDEIHKLVELRRDDDLCAAVALLAQL